MNKRSLGTEEVFTRALALVDDDRRLFLDEICGDDVELRRRVDRLLQAYDQHSDFLPEGSNDGGGELPDTDMPGLLQLDEPIGTVIDRYKLLERLAEGGFGIVYVAEQDKPVRRRVALKLIKPGMDTKDVIARFEAERQALALMDHPNVAKVLDAGATERGRPYFVMELVHGVKVTEYCDKKRLTTRERLSLFTDICRAVQHAHQKGIIHRDLKPSNILVTLHDGKPVPKVIDFGVSKALSQRLTEKTIYTSYGQMVGTPEYMSPEQAEMSGLGIDTRSDIYSLAVLLYELLTGKPPLDGKRLRSSGYEKMMRIIREEEPPRASLKLSTLGEEATEIATHRRTDTAKLRQSLHGDLDWILMKGLEKDRNRRYETANGLAADITRFLDNEPVTACPPSTIYRLRKFVRRNRIVVAGTSVMLLVLCLGLVGTTVGLTRAKAERNKALQLADENLNLAAKETAARTQAELARREAEYNAYVLQINVAATNLEHGNQMVARSALLATPLQHRNWEWGHLVDQAWPAQIRIDADNVAEKTSNITAADYWVLAPPCAIKKLDGGRHIRLASVIFAPHDQMVATTSADSTVRLWNRHTAELESTFPTTGAINLGLAMSHDRSLIAVGDAGGEVSVLEIGKQAKPRWSESSFHTRPISAIWFTPDDSKIIVAYFDGVVVVCESRTGSHVCSFDAHSSVIQSARFFPDGRRAITTGHDGSVRVWDLEAGEETEEPRQRPHNRAVSVQTLRPNRQQVATGFHDGSVMLWDIATAETVWELPDVGQGAAIEDLIFADDGSCLVAMVGKTSIQVLATATGHRIGSFEASLTNRPSVAVNQDGSRIATNSPDGITTIWAPAFLQQDDALTISDAHHDTIVQAAFSHDGTRIVTASYDKAVKVWDATTKELVTTFDGHEHEVLKADFSPDGGRVASISTRGTVRVWDSRTGEEIFRRPGTKQFLRSASSEGGIRGNILGFSAVFSASLFAPSGNRLIALDDSGFAVLDSITGRKRVTLEDSPAIGWPVISPNGRQLAMISDTLYDTELWAFESGRKLQPLSAHSRQADWASYSHDGSQLLTSSMDGTTIVWDSETGRQLHKLEGHQGNVIVSRFSPDGTRIGSASADGTAKIWNALTGECLCTFSGHTDRPSNLEFSPDGQRVLTTAVDDTVRVWEPTKARELLKLSGDSNLIYGTWSPDGRSILTCWKDGSVQLFEAFPWDGPWEGVNADPNAFMKESVHHWRGSR